MKYYFFPASSDQEHQYQQSELTYVDKLTG